MLNCKNCNTELNIPSGVRNEKRSIKCKNCKEINIIVFAKNGRVQSHKILN